MSGKKRGDMRYTDSSGEEWDSQFEAAVYKGAIDAGLDIRRCKRGSDTVPYFHQVRGASCKDCGSPRVGRARGITFDLFVTDGNPKRKEGKYYVEPKGYMRAPRRSLYKSCFKANPDLSVRFILQSNYRVGKKTIGEWINHYLKQPWFLWKGKYPKESEWIYPSEPKSRKSIKKGNK